MKGIHVDVAARTARAQGGVLWKEFNRETQLHGLATTGGVVGSTGIAGLTLGGGLGWLMPKYGLALDNLRSRRARDGRRQRRCAPAPTRTPTCSGRSAAAAATSASPRRSSTTLHHGRTDHHRRRRRASAAARARRAEVLPRHVRDAARRDDAGRRPPDRARRIGRQARRHRRRPLRVAEATARRRSGRSRRSARRCWTRWVRFRTAR